MNKEGQEDHERDLAAEYAVEAFLNEATEEEVRQQRILQTARRTVV